MTADSAERVRAATPSLAPLERQSPIANGGPCPARRGTRSSPSMPVARDDWGRSGHQADCCGPHVTVTLWRLVSFRAIGAATFADCSPLSWPAASALHVGMPLENRSRPQEFCRVNLERGRSVARFLCGLSGVSGRGSGVGWRCGGGVGWGCGPGPGETPHLLAGRRRSQLLFCWPHWRLALSYVRRLPLPWSLGSGPLRTTSSGCVSSAGHPQRRGVGHAWTRDLNPRILL